MSKTPFILLLALGLSVLSRAAQDRCVRAYAILGTDIAHVPKQDTAVELELPLFRLDPATERRVLDERVLRLLTTSDGKVSGLLGNDPPPDWLLELGKRQGVEDVRGISWHKLQPLLQHRLLRAMGKLRQTEESGVGEHSSRLRHIQGMRVRDTISVVLDKPIVLFGDRYEAGYHDAFPIGKYLSHPQTISHADQPRFRGVEVHVRAGASAPNRPKGIQSGRVSLDADKLLRAIGLEPIPHHVHQVAPVPVAKLKANPTLTTARLTELARRIDLIHEMMAIVERGGTLKYKWGADIAIYEPLSQADAADIANFWRQYAIDPETAALAQRQLPFSAFRTPPTYDSKVPLWGMETRLVTPGFHHGTRERILNAQQRAMETGDYGISEKTMARWVKLHGGKDLEDLPSALVYRKNRSLPIMQRLNFLGDEIKRLSSTWNRVIGRADREQPALLEEHAAWLRFLEHAELEMLTYDWSRDPLLFEDAAAKELVKKEQARARARLENDEPLNLVMKEFLVDSGLYARFTGSLRPGSGQP